ncbi:MAG TPA: hypothetical protein VF043_02705 [Ktedonobacteraceae bacterium]
MATPVAKYALLARRLPGLDAGRIRRDILPSVRLRLRQIPLQQERTDCPRGGECHDPLIFVTAVPCRYGEGFRGCRSHLGERPQRTSAYVLIRVDDELE